MQRFSEACPEKHQLTTSLLQSFDFGKFVSVSKGLSNVHFLEETRKERCVNP